MSLWPEDASYAIMFKVSSLNCPRTFATTMILMMMMMMMMTLPGRVCRSLIQALLNLRQERARQLALEPNYSPHSRYEECSPVLSLSRYSLVRARSLSLSVSHIHSRNRSFASISKGSMPSSRRCSCPRTTPSSSSITRSPRSVCLRTRQALVCASCISMRCWTIAPHVRYLSSLPLVRGVVSCTRSALAHRPSHARTLRGRYTPS